MIVRVHELNDEESVRSVLDALQNLGLHVTTGEESAAESSLFYTARMNSKLDNLGQLKHLFNIRSYIKEITDTVKPYYTDLLAERYARQAAARGYYNELSAKSSTSPMSRIPIGYLSFKEIESLFENH